MFRSTDTIFGKLDTIRRSGTCYTNWANYYLRKTGHDPAVRDLQADLRDGVLLSRIIEAVCEFYLN